MLEILRRTGSVCGERNRVNVSSPCDSSSELKRRKNVMDFILCKREVEQLGMSRTSVTGGSSGTLQPRCVGHRECEWLCEGLEKVLIAA